MPRPAIRKIILCISCFIDDELLLLILGEPSAVEEVLCFVPLPLAIPLLDVTESGDGLVWCGKRRLAKGCLLLLLFDFFLPILLFNLVLKQPLINCKPKESRHALDTMHCSVSPSLPTQHLSFLALAFFLRHFFFHFVSVSAVEVEDECSI